MGRISYQDYLDKFADHMDISEANDIYEKLYDQLDFQDEDIAEFYETLVERAGAYAGMRLRWSVMETGERLAEDDERTRLHNAYLNALSMMRTVLDKKGKSVEWYSMLGEDIEKRNRKRAGDFACYLVLFRSLGER